MSPVAWCGFVAAAAIGAPVRYLLDGWVTSRTGRAFPWGTFTINVTGSFILGVLTGLALYHGFPTSSRLILGTGFCGAYTTFSTFTFETVRLAEDGAYDRALGNLLLSLMAGGLAAGAGIAMMAL